MKRLSNGHIINISQDCSIVKIQEKHVQLNAAMKEISIIPSLMLLAVIGYAMFHLGWKMSFMVLLFAPLPTFIKLMGTAKKAKRRILILNQWVKIYAAVNERPGIWLLMICISLNNKHLIRQWILNTTRISPVSIIEKPEIQYRSINE
jgi:hypothetical protein